MSTKFNRPIDHRTPDVLLEMNWTNRKRFNSFLEIEMSFCNRIRDEIERKHFSRAPWEREVGLYRYNIEDKTKAKDGIKKQEEDDMNVI